MYCLKKYLLQFVWNVLAIPLGAPMEYSSIPESFCGKLRRRSGTRATTNGPKWEVLGRGAVGAVAS